MDTTPIVDHQRTDSDNSCFFIVHHVGSWRSSQKARFCRRRIPQENGNTDTRSIISLSLHCWIEFGSIDVNESLRISVVCCCCCCCSVCWRFVVQCVSCCVCVSYDQGRRDSGVGSSTTGGSGSASGGGGSSVGLDITKFLLMSRRHERDSSLPATPGISRTDSTAVRSPHSIDQTPPSRTTKNQIIIDTRFLKKKK